MLIFLFCKFLSLMNNFRRIIVKIFKKKILQYLLKKIIIFLFFIYCVLGFEKLNEKYEKIIEILIDKYINIIMILITLNNDINKYFNINNFFFYI